MHLQGHYIGKVVGNFKKTSVQNYILVKNTVPSCFRLKYNNDLTEYNYDISSGIINFDYQLLKRQTAKVVYDSIQTRYANKCD